MAFNSPRLLESSSSSSPLILSSSLRGANCREHSRHSSPEDGLSSIVRIQSTRTLLQRKVEAVKGRQTALQGLQYDLSTATGSRLQRLLKTLAQEETRGREVLLTLQTLLDRATRHCDYLQESLRSIENRIDDKRALLIAQEEELEVCNRQVAEELAAVKERQQQMQEEAISYENQWRLERNMLCMAQEEFRSRLCEDKHRYQQGSADVKKCLATEYESLREARELITLQHAAIELDIQQREAIIASKARELCHAEKGLLVKSQTILQRVQDVTLQAKRFLQQKNLQFEDASNFYNDTQDMIEYSQQLQNRDYLTQREEARNELMAMMLQRDLSIQEVESEHLLLKSYEENLKLEKVATFQRMRAIEIEMRSISEQLAIREEELQSHVKASEEDINRYENQLKFVCMEKEDCIARVDVLGKARMEHLDRQLKEKIALYEQGSSRIQEVSAALEMQLGEQATECTHIQEKYRADYEDGKQRREELTQKLRELSTENKAMEKSLNQRLDQTRQKQAELERSLLEQDLYSETMEPFLRENSVHSSPSEDFTRKAAAAPRRSSSAYDDLERLVESKVQARSAHYQRANLHTNSPHYAKTESRQEFLAFEPQISSTLGLARSSSIDAMSAHPYGARSGGPSKPTAGPGAVAGAFLGKLQQRGKVLNGSENRMMNDQLRIIHHLFSCCRHNKLSEVQTLLLQGVPISSVDVNGNTLLHIAAQNGRFRIARLAVELGCDPNIQNDHGNTPLHFSAQYNYLKLGAYLVSVGADTSIRNKDGLTPLEGISEADRFDLNGMNSTHESVGSGEITNDIQTEDTIEENLGKDEDKVTHSVSFADLTASDKGRL